MEKEVYIRLMSILLSLLLAIISCLWVGEWASSVSTHAKTINSLDEKADTILVLASSSIAASAVISAFPNDTASPIADKLADFSEYFLLILCVIYAEKYGVTLFCALAFRILIPGACLIGIIGRIRKDEKLRRLSLKIVLCALVIAIIIPISTIVSDKVYDTYHVSIENAIASAQQFTLQSDGETDGASDSGVIESFLNGVAATVSDILDKASDTVRRLIETLAVLIVTSCIIPVITMILFVWFVKSISGINLNYDYIPQIPKRNRKEKKKTEIAVIPEEG